MIKNAIRPILLFIHPFSFFFIYFLFIYFCCCCCCYLIDRPEKEKGQSSFSSDPAFSTGFNSGAVERGLLAPLLFVRQCIRRSQEPRLCLSRGVSKRLCPCCLTDLMPGPKEAPKSRQCCPFLKGLTLPLGWDWKAQLPPS